MAKRIRTDEGSQSQTSALADEGAWRILEEFLTTDMTYSQMEEAFLSYLGNQYSEDDWKESRDALFSGDSDDNVILENLRIQLKLKNPYLDLDAEEDDEEEQEKEEQEQEEDDNGPSESWKVSCLPGSSLANKFTAVINDLSNRFKDTQQNSSRDHQRLPSSISGLITSTSARLQDRRMYLLHVNRNVTDYIAQHLRKKNFRVTVSAWLAGQLYVVADSPKTIAKSLSLSLYLTVKKYVYIPDEECEVVEWSCATFPNPAWVRFKHDKYKGDIAQVFNSDLPNNFFAVLVPPQEFPYPMPRGSQSLLDRSRLPNGDTVSNINCSEEVVGCKYKGERYYMGLLLKSVHRDRLERVVCPHADDIQLHLQSGWGQSFLKSTVVAFAMQFLRVGNWARILKGDLSSEISLEIDIQLEDIERVFWVGNTVQVVAGPYLGVEGHIIQMVDDIFHLCQDISKEELEVSKYYLDHRPLSHTLQAQLPTQQPLNPLPNIESIQIGDSIDVLVGEHMGKSGIVHWLSKGGNYLWFQDGLLNIPVPVAVVQRIPNLQTLQYMQDRGYDVKPGDVVRVACGPEYLTKGVVQSIDFPNTCLTLLSEIDHSLVDIPIRFVIKVHNANLDVFKKDIGQEVFIIGGDHKGYRATLYSFTSKNCTIAVHGQQHTTIQLKDVATRYGMRLNDPSMSSSTWTAWTTSPEGPSSSLNPSQTAKPDPWTVNMLDNIDASMEEPKESPLAWLMNKEFSSKFTTFHAMLKVSPSFMGGRLHNRFVSMACPDPFLGLNGPAPEGYVAVFCSSNGAGAAIQHYHIPATDLSAAPPHKKNQQCIVLHGSHCGSISNVVKCHLKKNTVDIAITPSTFINLHFDQICLVEQSHMTM
ncbi:uncharacterized protein EDB91DRAFT_1085985 [Suillus paluster]|uniref:uncharacterized protein n=1 Tax=Suillus paluster TaxID=48578 RepID=UPI001B86937E|nr:uncharacterized protein EDB91DRAFT_1085985 [Suillus paluster]KAG1728744.1 hypothetical protein EDB91DRAFT_1085985 [Suillus paluster]